MSGASRRELDRQIAAKEAELDRVRELQRSEGLDMSIILRGLEKEIAELKDLRQLDSAGCTPKLAALILILIAVIGGPVIVIVKELMGESSSETVTATSSCNAPRAAGF